MRCINHCKVRQLLNFSCLSLVLTCYRNLLFEYFQGVYIALWACCKLYCVVGNSKHMVWVCLSGYCAICLLGETASFLGCHTRDWRLLGIRVTLATVGIGGCLWSWCCEGGTVMQHASWHVVFILMHASVLRWVCVLWQLL